VLRPAPRLNEDTSRACKFYLGVDVHDRPEEVLRVFLTAFDDVDDDVQGAPELLVEDCDEDEPDVLRLPPCDVPVPVRELLDDVFLVTRGSMRGNPLRVSYVSV